jgi:hypothetical protein
LLLILTATADDFRFTGLVSVIFRVCNSTVSPAPPKKDML